MKILITGHRGFIGSNALKYFKSMHQVDVYDYSTTMPDLDQGYNWVLHFGAISSTTERDIEKIMQQNYDFSCCLAEQCEQRSINLQYSSSASVYGLGTDFKESAPPDPRSPYAWSKYLFDRWVSRRKWSILVQGFRYFNVYGPGEDHKGDQASPYSKFTKQAREKGIIKLFEGSENYLRDFVHVSRVVHTHDQFLKINKSGIWNIGTGHTRSFLSVAQEIADEYGARIELIPMPEELKASYQKYTCADLTALKEALSDSSYS
jgi:ADP-L-glycero-D-manno-heptose 6-epimerase